MRAHTVSGHSTPGPGLGAASAPEVGRGGEEMTTWCHPPLPDPQPSQASHSPLARSGDVEETVLESKALVYFFFRSWEQRGQNLQRKVTEEVGEKVSEGEDALCHSAQGNPAPTTARAHHFPRGLVVSPTQAKWNHSMEHWKRKTVEEQRAGSRVGPRKEKNPPT